MIDQFKYLVQRLNVENGVESQTFIF